MLTDRTVASSSSFPFSSRSTSTAAGSAPSDRYVTPTESIYPNQTTTAHLRSGATACDVQSFLVAAGARRVYLSHRSQLLLAPHTAPDGAATDHGASSLALGLVMRLSATFIATAALLAAPFVSAQLTPNNLAATSTSGSLSALKYTKVGSTGSYDQVTNILPGTFPTCDVSPFCVTETKEISG